MVALNLSPVILVLLSIAQCVEKRLNGIGSINGCMGLQTALLCYDRNCGATHNTKLLYVEDNGRRLAFLVTIEMEIIQLL